MKVAILTYNKIKSISYMKDELVNRGIYTENYNDADLIIRWGSSKESWLDYKTTTSANSVKNAANKKKMVEIFIENDIASLASTNFDNICFPCYVFTEKHAHGNGLYILTSPEDYRQLKERFNVELAYWAPLLPIKQEYRCHLVKTNEGWKYLLLRKVFSKDKNLKPKKYSFLVRNRKAGYVFFIVKKWFKIYNRIIDECIKAMEVLGLNHGAVDVATYYITKDKLGINIFEVNSGPSLSPRTAKFYVENLLKEV